MIKGFTNKSHHSVCNKQNIETVSFFFLLILDNLVLGKWWKYCLNNLFIFGTYTVIYLSCRQASPVAGSEGCSPVSAHGLLIVAASLVAERRLQLFRRVPR